MNTLIERNENEDFLLKEIENVSEFEKKNLICFEIRRIQKSKKDNKKYSFLIDYNFNLSVDIAITILAMFSAHLWMLKHLNFWSCKVGYFRF